jgi:ABC-type Fe3+-hydroxamate transport system substrate-binding protein
MNVSAIARLLAAASAVLLAGCATTAADTSSTTPSSDRPHPVPLNGQDPCALVPSADLPRFQLDQPGRWSINATYKSPQCFYTAASGSFRILLVVTAGIDTLSRDNPGTTIAAEYPVAGYPAYSVTAGQDSEGCDIAVDVSDGQYLLTSATVDSYQRASFPERCGFAHQLAASAMTTLLAG